MSVKSVDMRRTWRSRLVRNFFGLSNNYILAVYDEFFLLKYHGNWSFIEAYNLPIQIRRYFLRKLQEQIEKENEAVDDAKSKARRR